MLGIRVLLAHRAHKAFKVLLEIREVQVLLVPRDQVLPPEVLLVKG
jgi:hypothetical protein